MRDPTTLPNIVEVGPPKADNRFQLNLDNIERRVGRALRSTLPSLCAQVPDPSGAVNLLDRFITAAGPRVLAAIRDDLSLAQALLIIFSQSHFLAETLIQSPDLLLWLDHARRLDRVKTPDELQAEVTSFCFHAAPPDRSLALNRFKRREYLRIVLRDLLGLSTLTETTAELSHLADGLLSQAYRWSWTDLIARYGTPRRGGTQPFEPVRPVFPGSSDNQRFRSAAEQVEMAVIGLGKLGGVELNYSSDVDLMFVYAAEGDTDASGYERLAVSNHEFFIRMAQEITRYMSEMTAEGAAYRVDLRLRPRGTEGEITCSMAQAKHYYQHHARDWECQMLVKARPCAGAFNLAREFLRNVSACVYRPGQNFDAIESVLAARGRMSAQLERSRVRKHRSATMDVKLDPGGIRDIEFLVQCLQRLHGGGEHWLRVGPTLVAMQRLTDKGLLTGGDFQLLSAGYTLLRNTEHRVQLHLGQQTHSLPDDVQTLAVLARSLSRYAAPGGAWSMASAAMPATRRLSSPQDSAASATAADEELATLFRIEVERTMAAVRRLYERVLYSQPKQHEVAEFRLAAVSGTDLVHAPAKSLSREVSGFLEASTLDRHGRRNLERFLQAASTAPAALRELSALTPSQLAYLASALNTSDYVTDALALRPTEVSAFAHPFVAPDERQRELLASPKRLPSSLADRVLTEAGSYRERMRLLRLLHHRRLLQTLIGELISPPHIGQALRRITHLAEDALECALLLAAQDLDGDTHPLSLGVIGLGRLGLHEFDVFSDLDIVFVAPPDRLEEAVQLATRSIEVLTAYTQEGALFSVDTRLRPSGGEGELVQTPSAFESYFKERAGAWEAVSYLKARAVAGNVGVAADVLKRIRPIIYERFSDPQVLNPALADMRVRIARELRAKGRELKTGEGGYYDLDFVLSSVALRNPAVELTGLGFAGIAAALASATSLESGDAAQLASAANVLRAADHCLRIVSGKVAKGMPQHGHAAQAGSDLLGRVLRRAVPDGLAAEVAGARAVVRETYERLIKC